MNNEKKNRVRITQSWTVPIYQQTGERVEVVVDPATEREHVVHVPIFTDEPVRHEKRSRVVFSGSEAAFEIWKHVHGDLLNRSDHGYDQG